MTLKSFPKSVRWSAGLRNRTVAVLAGFAALAAGEARAVTCTVDTAPVDFGVYVPSSTSPRDSAGYVDVRCTCVVVDCAVFGYRLDLAAGGSGSTSARRLKRAGGADTLSYSLFQDSARTATWGSGPEGVGVVYLLALFGSYQRTPVYGRLNAGQQVRPGTYSDAPAVTILY